MSKSFRLACGRQTVVDASDYKWLSALSWYASITSSGKAYIKCHARPKNLYMHRLITNCPSGMCVDHIDGNSMNNRRSNLRICRQSDNSKNRKRPKSNSSGYAGVWWYETNKRWLAFVDLAYKRLLVGCYADKFSAAEARDFGAIMLHGEFATLNLGESYAAPSDFK